MQSWFESRQGPDIFSTLKESIPAVEPTQLLIQWVKEAHSPRVIGRQCESDQSSPPNRVKKNQLDVQLILSIFRQPLHVSGVSRPIIRRYNRMYTIGTYYSF